MCDFGKVPILFKMSEHLFKLHHSPFEHSRLPTFKCHAEADATQAVMPESKISIRKNQEKHFVQSFPHLMFFFVGVSGICVV